MNCHDFAEHLLDYIYGELPEGDLGARMDAHAAECDGCRASVREYDTTRSFLAAWDDSGLPAVTIDPKKVSRRPRSRWGERIHQRRWLPMAAMLFLALGMVLTVFSLANVSVQMQQGTIQISFGSHQKASVTEEQRLLQTIDRMISESEDRQLNKTMDLLQNVYFRLEEERLNDQQSVRDVFDVYDSQIERNNDLMEMTLQQLGYTTNAK